MDINDVPVEEFAPVCCECGEKITGSGYKIDDKYYCEDCMAEHSINGYEVADGFREAAWEAAHPRDYD